MPGALHQAIGVGFDILVQHCGCARRQRGARDRIDEQSPNPSRPWGGHAKAHKCGHDDQQAQPGFGERHQIAQDSRARFHARHFQWDRYFLGGPIHAIASAI